jgi:hypothetical protein
MPFSRTADFDVLRTLGFASISASYAAVGGPFTHLVRAVTFINATAGDLFFALTPGSTPLSDGTADKIFIPAGTSRVYDIASDANELTNTNSFVLPKGTQIWVRQSTAPTSKSVYIECLIAIGE